MGKAKMEGRSSSRGWGVGVCFEALIARFVSSCTFLAFPEVGFFLAMAVCINNQRGEIKTM